MTDHIAPTTGAPYDVDLGILAAADPTTDQVEAAARALYESDGAPTWPWDELEQRRKHHIANFYRRKARVALDAANTKPDDAGDKLQLGFVSQAMLPASELAEDR